MLPLDSHRSLARCGTRSKLLLCRYRFYLHVGKNQLKKLSKRILERAEKVVKRWRGCILQFMTTVLAFGTFDKFHEGHQWFLQEAKKHGQRLVVVVARDHNVQLVKGRLPKYNEQARLATVQGFSAVNEAKLGLEDYSKKDTIIATVNPDIICLGYDQAPNFQPPSSSIQVVRLPAFHPDKYKSSLLQ